MKYFCLVFIALIFKIDAAPATVRVSFSSPPHSYHHGLDITGGVSTIESSSNMPYTYAARSFNTQDHAINKIHHPSHTIQHHGESYVSGPTVEISPIIDIDVPAPLPHHDEEPTEAELQSLIERFADNRPRFFSDFPHQRALLANIELRTSQHLQEYRLGSIRPGSPFFRM